ncbi:MAG: hypothetical protein IJK76_00875, partial [Bacteroidales bacterium]|nr:hypothetical protein [Bacteroidales bacterium]
MQKPKTYDDNKIKTQDNLQNLLKTKEKEINSIKKSNEDLKNKINKLIKKIKEYEIKDKNIKK